jgi:hypothetical protein
MKRYAVITKADVYSGETKVGEIVVDKNEIGYQARIEEDFHTSADIAFLGKVLDFIEDNGDLDIEEDIK